VDERRATLGYVDQPPFFVIVRPSHDRRYAPLGWLFLTALLIAIGIDEAFLQRSFCDVRVAAVFRCRWCPPVVDELPIRIASGPRRPISVLQACPDLSEHSGPPLAHTGRLGDTPQPRLAFGRTEISSSFGVTRCLEWECFTPWRAPCTCSRSPSWGAVS